MEIIEKSEGAILIVKPSGPITGEEAAGTVRGRVGRLTRSALGRVVLDLSEVPYVDSKGVESLLDSAESLATVGITLRLCGVTETVRDVLRITGTDVNFEFHDDTQSAVRSFL